MIVVLAEKPSVAREIAHVLGAATRHEGYLAGRGYQVTWAFGHLVSLKDFEDYDPQLKRWSLAALPFVPPRFELKLRGDAQAREQFRIIQRLLKGAREVIGATDAGREGELILRYILQLAGCTHLTARRAWLKSLTAPAIRQAFQSLRPLADYDDLYAAARCRSEADWIVGLNATRNLTVRYGGHGMLWSVGRVQTPVLAMIVRRDDEIRTFRPDKFWELLTKYRRVVFRYAGERFSKQEDAARLLERVTGHDLVIRKIQRTPERSLPPQLYDLTELQRDMNRRYGLSAAATLQSAQSLYESKLITYPRTDSRHLSSDVQREVPEIMRQLEPLRPEAIGKLELTALPFSNRIVDNKKVGDHHAIIPTGARPASLGARDQKVFDAIVTRFIAVFYPPCLKEVTTVEADCQGVAFRAKGVRVVEPGWTELYPAKPKKAPASRRGARANDAEEEDVPEDDAQSLPSFAEGEQGPHEPSVREGQTTPPKHFTENTLLGAMETAGQQVDDAQLREAMKERGLGTPATRAAIIETLLQRNYIERQHKNLIATNLGRYLIALVQDEALKSPQLTGQWEARLKQIEDGRASAPEFMKDIAEYTREIIASSDLQHVDEQRLGNCPRCGHEVIQGRRGFGCSAWREGCTFVLWPTYDEQPLTLPQVRSLLQHGMLRAPFTKRGGTSVILVMRHTGELLEIPVPAAGQQSAAPVKRHTKGRSRKPSKRAAKTFGRAPAAAQGLGTCPLCGGEVIEQPKSYSCSRWREGCKLTIWKTIAGKRISPRTASTLLRTGQTAVLKGFKSKAGAPFAARLKLMDGQVQFEFEK